MIRVYKNRRTCFYRRMSAARMAQKPFTKVTAPKSIVSANSTTGAYPASAVRQTQTYFIISRSAGKSNRAPVKKNYPPQLTVKAALWYDNKACGRRFSAHGLPVRIHVCGSSVTLRPGCLTESKSEDYKIAAVFSAVPICARGGIGRRAGFR